MSLRRAGAGTLRLIRAYAAASASQQGQGLLLRQLPAALQLHLPCPLTPHSLRYNAWWQSQLQHSASVDAWRQLSTSSGSSGGGKDKDKETKPQLPDAEVRAGHKQQQHRAFYVGRPTSHQHTHTHTIPCSCHSFSLCCSAQHANAPHVPSTPLHTHSHIQLLTPQTFAQNATGL
jgi:hypothetical protein